jgi:hypothetical protein
MTALALHVRSDVARPTVVACDALAPHETPAGVALIAGGIRP